MTPDEMRANADRLRYGANQEVKTSSGQEAADRKRDRAALYDVGAGLIDELKSVAAAIQEVSERMAPTVIVEAANKRSLCAHCGCSKNLHDISTFACPIIGRPSTFKARGGSI